MFYSLTANSLVKNEKVTRGGSMTEKNHHRVRAFLLGILSLGMFPLLLAAEDVKQADFVGAETCLSCHSDKSSFKDNNHAKAWPHAKNIDFGNINR